jgi:ferric-dicitrate binding protein FerR (iron transport regulator)
MKMRRGVLLTALGVLALFACECDAPKPAPPPSPVIVATVVSRLAPVNIERGGKKVDAAPQASLFAGDLLSTGPGGGAVIRYVDGTQILVNENTRFRVNGAAGRLTLELEEGTVVSDARTEGGQVQVITRYGAAAILRGSEVEFALSAQGGSMDVAFGEIRLVGADGGTTAVVAGQELAFDLGARPGAAGDAGSPDASVAEVSAGGGALAWKFGAAKDAARVRPPGEKRFSSASAEPVEIGSGTQFEVRPRGSARLAGEGVELELDAKTRGTVGEAKREGAVDRFALTLTEGEGLLHFPGDAERVMTLTGRGRTVRLHAREEATVRIRQGARGTEVNVLVGQVEISGAEGEGQAVKPGQRADVGAAGVKINRPGKPVVVVPHSRRVRIYATKLGPVGLAVPTADPPPRVEVSRNAKFEQPFLIGRAHDDVLAIEPPARGDVYWRALDAAGTVLARGHARFDRDSARADLDNPKAEVAETGLKASVFFQGAPPAISFSFAPREGAKSYRVRVYRASDLKNPVAEKVVPEPRCAFEAGRLPEGDYLWHAAPVDANGTELAGGRMNKLEIVYDNSHTTLAIARPRPGEASLGSVTPVRGVAPLGSKLYVNGKQAELDPKGRFSLDVRRADAVVFRLVAENGAESWWVRSLRRDR